MLFDLVFCLLDDLVVFLCSDFKELLGIFYGLFAGGFDLC